MGSICPKKIPPYEAKSVSELADRVVEKFVDSKKNGSDDISSLIENSCAEEFWKHWRLKDKDDRKVEVNKKMFLFLVLVSWLEKSKQSRGQTLEILTSIKKEIFTDPDMVECTVHFQVWLMLILLKKRNNRSNVNYRMSTAVSQKFTQALSQHCLQKMELS